MKNEKKSPYVKGNEVAVRDMATDIVEMVEDILDRYGIYVPDEDRNGDDGEACLYGMTHARLEDSISFMLSDLVNDVNPEFKANDCFSNSSGNKEEYFSCNDLNFVHGEFTQMLTISTLHLSLKTVALLDQECDSTSENPFPQRCPHCEKKIEGSNNLPPVFEKDGYGWFVFVDPDTMDEDFPIDLRQAMEYAAKQGGTCLFFDADAEVIPELSVYRRDFPCRGICMGC